MKLSRHPRSPVATHASGACRDWKWVFNRWFWEKNAIIITLFVSLEFYLLPVQLRTKHTKTFFLGGAYFWRLPLLHLCQHGWRSRRKTTSDCWETTGLQTLPARTPAVSLCVLRLEPWLSLLHGDVFLHWDSKFCCLCFKCSVSLCPKKQRICNWRFPNFM